MPPRKRRREAAERDKAGGSAKTEIRYRARRVHPLEFRVRLVREIRERKVAVDEVARIFGVNRGTLYDWVKRYEEEGLEGLAPKAAGPRRKGRSGAAAAKREAVTKLREEHPEWGTRRISDVLRRFQALGVSETVVRRILHEEGLLVERASQEPAREHPPRRSNGRPRTSCGSRTSSRSCCGGTSGCTWPRSWMTTRGSSCRTPWPTGRSRSW